MFVLCAEEADVLKRLKYSVVMWYNSRGSGWGINGKVAKADDLFYQDGTLWVKVTSLFTHSASMD